jgi:hypothetical protein
VLFLVKFSLPMVLEVVFVPQEWTPQLVRLVKTEPEIQPSEGVVHLVLRVLERQEGFVSNAPRVRPRIKESVKRVPMVGGIMVLAPVFRVIQGMGRSPECAFLVLAIKLLIKAFVLPARVMKLISTEAVDAPRAIIKRLMTPTHRHASLVTRVQTITVSIPNVLVQRACIAMVRQVICIALHILVQSLIKFISGQLVSVRVRGRKGCFKIRVWFVAPSMPKSLQEAVSAIKILF